MTTLHEMLKAAQQNIDDSLDECFEKEGLKQQCIDELKKEHRPNAEKIVEEGLQHIKKVLHDLVISEQEVQDIEQGLSLVAQHIFQLPARENIPKNFRAALA